MNDFNDKYFQLRKIDTLKRQDQYKYDCEFILQNLNLHIGLKLQILDFGGSDGSFLLTLRKYLNFKGTIVDVNDDQLVRASKFFDTTSKIPDSGNFDVIIMRGVFQHLPDISVTLNALMKLIKPNGKLFILSIPNPNSPVYTITGTLPMLKVYDGFTSNFNIWPIPKIYDELSDSLTPIAIEYPYWNSAYRSFILDSMKFIINVFYLFCNFFLRKSLTPISHPYFFSIINLGFLKKSKENT